MSERTKHERILLQRPARVYVERSGQTMFEMFCTSRDLSISGIFLNSDALLRIGTGINIDLEVREDEWLVLNGEVIRRIEFNDREHEPGFAVRFGTLSPKSHETLLRYFVTDRIVDFTRIFRQAFPHLEASVTEQDLALVVNLWEDNRHQLVDESRVAPVKPPPQVLLAPPRPPPAPARSTSAPSRNPAPPARAAAAPVRTQAAPPRPAPAPTKAAPAPAKKKRS